MSRRYTAFIILLFSLLSSHVMALPEVTATYQSTSKQGFNKKVSNFTFSRNNQQVVTIYPQKNTAEYWQKSADGRHQFYRFFTANQRSVYYPSSDLRSLNINRNWDSIEQLVPAIWLTRLKKMPASQQADSSTIEHYKGQLGELWIELDWRSEQQIPQRLLTKKGYKSKELILQDFSLDTKSIQQQLVGWMRFSSIDYADVGDSEDDPFLAQMINQGFIEHAASSVYDANGKMIKSGHVH
ncbi:hypothetical protein [Agarivorans sp. Z349TD_8]|uniref:hypothetical protein n=1 Tax=Agarivorans sp. Z349TD_8 TaxID=3421434 RepID=UPI003D7F17E1